MYAIWELYLDLLNRLNSRISRRVSHVVRRSSLVVVVVFVVVVVLDMLTISDVRLSGVNSARLYDRILGSFDRV